ncbi:MAG TPA: hypothetical protein VHM30_04115, partial [Gemmatimonadaceae bacterium]|nr:hypothetical protein [Gemmatimonadaceae bacterium]
MIRPIALLAAAALAACATTPSSRPATATPPVATQAEAPRARAGRQPDTAFSAPQRAVVVAADQRAIDAIVA